MRPADQYGDWQAVLLKRTILALACIVVVPSPAFAKGDATPNFRTGDPSERICEKIVVTGSRLAAKKFCGTRAQWADKQLQDRQEVERIQRSPCVLTHMTVGVNGNGHPAC